MVTRNVCLAAVVILSSLLAFGSDGEIGQATKMLLRPELVDSGLCNFYVPREGNYSAAPQELIEIDVSRPLSPSCEPDRITISTDNEAVIKLYKVPYRTIDTGALGVSTSGTFFKAVKKGEATITLTMEIVSPPSTLSFQYHINVQ